GRKDRRGARGRPQLPAPGDVPPRLRRGGEFHRLPRSAGGSPNPRAVDRRLAQGPARRPRGAPGDASAASEGGRAGRSEGSGEGRGPLDALTATGDAVASETAPGEIRGPFVLPGAGGERIAAWTP